MPINEKGADAVAASNPGINVPLQYSTAYRIADAVLQGAMFGSAAFAVMTFIPHIARALS